MNEDNVKVPTVVISKHYTLNILSSDHCSVLKLYWKFENSGDALVKFS